MAKIKFENRFSEALFKGLDDTLGLSISNIAELIFPPETNPEETLRFFYNLHYIFRHLDLKYEHVNILLAILPEEDMQMVIDSFLAPEQY